MLEDNGLGKVIEIKPQRGTSIVRIVCSKTIRYPFLFLKMYQFQKKDIPTEPDEKQKFMEALLEFGVSLGQFRESINREDVTMLVM